MNEFKIFLLILGAGEPTWVNMEPNTGKKLVSLYSNSREIAWATNTSENVKSLAKYNIRRKP